MMAYRKAKVKLAVTLVAFLLLSSILQNGLPFIHVQAQSPTTLFSVNPRYVSATSERFNVTIVVANVTDLYAWQTMLLFNSTVLNATNVWLSLYPYYIFYNSHSIRPIPVINNTLGYVLLGDSLLGDLDPTYNGSGILCQIEFQAKSLGTSPLIFSRPLEGEGSRTFLLDSNLNFIPLQAVDGQVLVGTPEDNVYVSSLDISFSNSNPYPGELVIISTKVHNPGRFNLENVVVEFYDTTTLIGRELIPSISHHSYGVATTEWTAQGEGFHLIKVIVDPGDNIIETSEDDNEATRSIFVGEILTSGEIFVTGSVSPNKTYAGARVIVEGSAVYSTTYGAGEPVAGANVTVTIIGEENRWVNHTVRTGSYSLEISAPLSPGNYTVVATVTDYTFSESVEIKLTVQPSAGIDLIVRYYDVSFIPADPVENNYVTIVATIHNVGNINAANVTIRFYDDKNLVNEITLDIIPAGDSTTTSTTWNATPWGWHRITVIVDPHNRIAEVNEGNNEASKNIYVYPALPDLTPTNIIFSDSDPEVNQKITISATVKSIGGVGASSVLVNFYEGNQPIGNATIPWIPGKGVSETASIAHTFVTGGERTIRVMADPENNIFEADEGNNWHSKKIYVHLPSPDLTLSRSDITFSNNTPTDGDIVTIYATIHNEGEADAHNVTVEFFDAATRIVSPITVSLIPAGGWETVNVLWNATPAGWHRIKVIIDGNNVIMESNENNNEATRYIYVYPPVAADLFVRSEDIVFSNPNPDLGENVTIYATIHNIGETEAKNIIVVFYINDVQLGLPKTISSIPIGQQENVSTKWIASQTGSHVVKVEVDTPLESDKTNNVATRAIIVGAVDFSITASPASLTIQQGSSDTSVITITSIGGFSQPVQLTVSGALSGVTATLNPQQVTPPPDGTVTSTLTVSADTTATPGSYTLTMTGTNGIITHSVNTPLEITPAPPTPPSEWTFAIITDLHIGRGYSNYNGESYYLTDRLQTVVKWISDNAQVYNIKFVVVLGDITEDGTEVEMNKAKEILNHLNDEGNIPYFPVIGNHDHTGQDDQYFDSVFNTTFIDTQHTKLGAGCTRWTYVRTTIVEPNSPAIHLHNYAFEYQGKNFVFLDFVDRATILGTPKLETWTMNFLKEQLDQAEPTILFSHHPMIESKGNFHIGKTGDDTWTDLNDNITSASARVLANFAGHIHGYYDPTKPFFNPMYFDDAETALHWQEDHVVYTASHSPYFYNASYNYKGSQFATAGDIPVITTEALMVGSNTNTKNGIIRIVSVSEDSFITWTPQDTAFPSLNPYIISATTSGVFLSGTDVDFQVYAFTEIFSWNYPITYCLYIDGVLRRQIDYEPNIIYKFENERLSRGIHDVNLTVIGHTPDGGQVMENIKRTVIVGRLTVHLRCPAEIVVTDPAGRTISKQGNEIPDATYTEAYLDGDGDFDKFVEILAPIDGDYAIALDGTGIGFYSMTAQFATVQEVVSFNATQIPISSGAIQQYTINWTALSQSEDGVTVQVDSNGDGMFEHTFTAGNKLTHLPGDINGDGEVDVRDISAAARAFGSYPGHPRWNPIADENEDGSVDIRDLALIARKFGKTYR